jgi:Flp pilus assembly protein TadG
MIMRFFGCTRGGIAAMTALIAPVLIGVSGLGVELGYWYAVRHSMQGAADAGVIEAALSYKNGNTGGFSSSAKAVTAQNGWLDGSGGTGQVISVAVNTPPVNGIYASNNFLNKAFEVVISRPEKSMFAWAVGYSASPNITVHAVALINSQSNGCILALSTSPSALTVTGNGNLQASNCGVDSDGSIAVNGAPARLNAGSVTVGASSVPCPSPPNCTVSGSVTTNTPVSDPYAGRDFTTPPSTLVTSLTRSLTIATGTTAIPHGFTALNSVTVAGATGAAYNGTFTIATVPDTTHFTYAIVGTPASPDPGTTVTACETATGATFYPAAIYCGGSAGPASYASDTVFSGAVNLSNGTTTFGASNAAGTCPASPSVVYFEGGLQIAGGNTTVNFCPGVYYIEGGSLSVTGNTVNLNGTGVTIILTTLPWGTPSYATATVAGKGTVTLSAPKSNVSITLPDGSSATEQVSGLVFFMDRNAPSSTAITIGGNGSTINLTGVIYAPTGNVKIAGNGVSGQNTTCTQLVANTINVNGNGTFQNGCTGDGTGNIGGGNTVTMAE